MHPNAPSSPSYLVFFIAIIIYCHGQCQCCCCWVRHFYALGNVTSNHFLATAYYYFSRVANSVKYFFFSFVVFKFDQMVRIIKSQMNVRRTSDTSLTCWILLKIWDIYRPISSVSMRNWSIQCNIVENNIFNKILNSTYYKNTILQALTKLYIMCIDGRV